MNGICCFILNAGQLRGVEYPVMNLFNQGPVSSFVHSPDMRTMVDCYRRENGNTQRKSKFQ